MEGGGVFPSSSIKYANDLVYYLGERFYRVLIFISPQYIGERKS